MAIRRWYSLEANEIEQWPRLDSRRKKGIRVVVVRRGRSEMLTADAGKKSARADEI